MIYYAIKFNMNVYCWYFLMDALSMNEFVSGLCSLISKCFLHGRDVIVLYSYNTIYL